MPLNLYLCLPSTSYSSYKKIQGKKTMRFISITNQNAKSLQEKRIFLLAKVCFVNFLYDIWIFVKALVVASIYKCFTQTLTQSHTTTDTPSRRIRNFLEQTMETMWKDTSKFLFKYFLSFSPLFRSRNWVINDNTFWISLLLFGFEKLLLFIIIGLDSIFFHFINHLIWSIEACKKFEWGQH